jgi:hypothetical protein
MKIIQRKKEHWHIIGLNFLREWLAESTALTTIKQPPKSDDKKIVLGRRAIKSACRSASSQRSPREVRLGRWTVRVLPQPLRCRLCDRSFQASDPLFFNLTKSPSNRGAVSHLTTTLKIRNWLYAKKTILQSMCYEGLTAGTRLPKWHRANSLPFNTNHRWNKTLAMS